MIKDKVQKNVEDCFLSCGRIQEFAEASWLREVSRKWRLLLCSSKYPPKASQRPQSLSELSRNRVGSRSLPQKDKRINI